MKRLILPEPLLNWMMRAARMASFVSLGIAPLFLIYQGGRFMALKYWADVSIGSIFYSTREGRIYASGITRIITDMFWIPFWIEFVILAIVFFILYAWIWNYLDVKREQAKRDRRTRRRGTAGGSYPRKSRTKRGREAEAEAEPQEAD